MEPTPLNKDVIEEMKNEFNAATEMHDEPEVGPIHSVEKKKVLIPDAIIRNIVNTETALICSMVTKNSSDHIKELARRSLEPTQDDFKVTRDFLQELLDVYAPTFLNGKNSGLWALGGLWAANAALKYNTVSIIVAAQGKK